MGAPYLGRTRGVRWNPKLDGDNKFEMWCPGCATKGGTATFWPITTDFWLPGALSRCKACWAEHKRAAEKHRKASKRDKLIADNHAYYQDNRDLLRWKDNQRKAAKRTTP